MLLGLPVVQYSEYFFFFAIPYIKLYNEITSSMRPKGSAYYLFVFPNIVS